MLETALRCVVHASFTRVLAASMIFICSRDNHPVPALLTGLDLQQRRAAGVRGERMLPGSWSNSCWDRPDVDGPTMSSPSDVSARTPVSAPASPAKLRVLIALRVCPRRNRTIRSRRLPLLGKRRRHSGTTDSPGEDG